MESYLRTDNMSIFITVFSAFHTILGTLCYAQSCLTFPNPMDCNLPGPSVHGIFWQEYWSRWPFPSPGNLPDLGIKPGSPALQADFLQSEPPGKHLHYGGDENMPPQIRQFGTRIF